MVSQKAARQWSSCHVKALRFNGYFIKDLNEVLWCVITLLVALTSEMVKLCHWQDILLAVLPPKPDVIILENVTKLQIFKCLVIVSLEFLTRSVIAFIFLYYFSDLEFWFCCKWNVIRGLRLSFQWCFKLSFSGLWHCVVSW